MKAAARPSHIEALAHVRVAGDVGRKNLDGDRAIEPDIPRSIHFSHSPRAERRLNLVRTEAGARRQRHGFVLFAP